MKLREIIIEAVGEDMADEEYFENLGYDKDTLEYEVKKIGTCWDGDGCQADVYDLPGGYHVSGKSAEMYYDELPEGFVPVA